MADKSIEFVESVANKILSYEFGDFDELLANACVKISLFASNVLEKAFIPILVFREQKRKLKISIVFPSNSSSKKDFLLV